MTEPNPPQWQGQQWQQDQWQQGPYPYPQPQPQDQPPYPYAQQWQQPGYAPGYPAPPAKSAPIVLIVCSLVAVLIAGGGVAVWMAFNHKGGGGGGGGTGLHVAWSQKPPSSLPSTDESIGVWVSGGTVAVATDSAITAYALADGKASWSWKPASGDQICAVSQTADGGIGAVAYGSDGATCTSLQAVDVATGKSAWAHAASLIPEGADSDDSFPAPFVSGGVAYAVDSALELDAFDLTSGAQRWTSDSASKFSSDDCMVNGATTIDGTVYAGADCDSGAYLFGFSPASGKIAGQTALPKSCADPAQLKYTWAAGQDAIVDCTDTSGDNDTADFLIIAPSTGKISSESLPSKELDPFDGSSVQGTPGTFAVSGDTLYVETLTGDNEDGTDEVLNALSLSTGAKQWSKPLARNFTLLGADANGCVGLAYGVTSADDGDNLEAMRYTANSGASSTLGSMNDDDEDYSDLPHQPVVLLGTQVVVVGESVDPAETFVSVVDGL